NARSNSILASSCRPGNLSGGGAVPVASRWLAPTAQRNQLSLNTILELQSACNTRRVLQHRAVSAASCTRSLVCRGAHQSPCEVHTPGGDSCSPISSVGLFASRKLGALHSSDRELQAAILANRARRAGKGCSTVWSQIGRPRT